jgi:hypothetical protein
VCWKNCLEWLNTPTWGPDSPAGKKECKQPKPLPIKDEQSGEPYEVVPETRFAVIVAAISETYLIAVLMFLLWLLFDTWSGRDVLLVRFGYDKAVLATASFRLLAYVGIGGAIGGAVDGLRSLIFWHAEKRAYGPRFIWRELALPPIGAAVALICYAIVRGGVGVLSGDVSLDPKGGTPVMAAFAVGTLAGFSAIQVFQWFDAQANKIFSVKTKSQTTIVPDITGMTIDEATTALKNAKLVLGTRCRVPDETKDPNDTTPDVILRQTPDPGRQADVQSAVNVIYGPSKTSKQPDPRKQPDPPT